MEPEVRGGAEHGGRGQRAAGAAPRGLRSAPAPRLTHRVAGSAGVLVALYEEPEKPDSALDFLKHHLGASAPENPELEALRLEVAEMKEKYEAVLEENKKLKTKLAQYEPPQDEKHGE
uniref:MYCBP protein n=1 Tax=Junco hyemalis TaxID=40217 RepID=A0A8C5IPH2_JUNHY